MGEQLSTEDLAKRWGLSTGTLQNWRSAGKGPAYTKIGRTVSYLLSDVEQYEQEQRRRPQG